MLIVHQERVPLGNYPKWAGVLIAWFLKKKLPKGSTILLRGRKPDWKKLHKDGKTLHWFGPVTIPLKYAKRVGIYAIQTRRYHQQDN